MSPTINLRIATTKTGRRREKEVKSITRTDKSIENNKTERKISQEFKEKIVKKIKNKSDRTKNKETI